MAEPAAGQSLKEMHRLLCAAIVQRRAVAALYDGARRLLCPHVLGYGQPGEWRVFCYQYGGEQERTLAGGRTGSVALSIFEETLQRGAIRRGLAQCPSRPPAMRAKRRDRCRELSSWR